MPRLAGFALLLCLAACNPTPRGPSDEALKRLNTGIALLEQHNFGKAQAEFDEALKLHPAWVEGHVDLAIALAAQVKYPEAEAELAKALALEPDNPTANYMSGLIHKYKGEKEAGVAAFEKVREKDPDDIDTKFNLATLYKDTGQADRAIPMLEDVIQGAPHFLSAWYALGQLLLRQGQEKKDEALLARGREYIEKFQTLSGGTSGEAAGLRYGEQGKYGLALEDRASDPPAAAVALRWSEAARASGLDFRHAGAAAGEWGGGVLVYDLDGDDDEDLVLAGAADGTAARLYRNDGKGGFTDATGGSGLDTLRAPAAGLAAGDVDGDGAADLLVAGRLFRGDGKGVFTDSTEASALAGLLAGAVSLSFVDLDHDGDLDLAATFPGGGSALRAFQNDGKGVFRETGAETGIGGPGGAVSLVASDLDNDRDIDLLVGVKGGAPRLYSNLRDLRFVERAAAAGLGPGGETRGVSAGDVDGDGYPDLVLTNLAGGHSIFRNTRNGKFAPAQSFAARAPAAGVLFLDADLDGDADLVWGDARGLQLWRNDGQGQFRDETGASGLDSIPGDVRGLAAGDLDGDGDVDLVASVFGGAALLLRNDLPAGQGWIQLRLSGTNSNRPGFGTKIELRAGRLHHKLETRGADGFLSQSSPVAAFGLGGRRAADRVRLLWPGGVLQAETTLAAGRRSTVEELDRKGSSCPFLWAWDGEQMRFVSDIQGGSPLGLWIAPTLRNLPDPDEWFLLPDGLARPRDGAYDLRITESLEEIAYLDRVRLRVIDAPAAYRVFPNERLLLAPPFAPPGLHFIAATRAPERAVDAAGNDALPALAAIDRRYSGALRRTRYRGFAEPWTLELDFGRLTPAERGQPLVLLAHGYVEFSNSTPMYAAAQAGQHFSLPALDVLDASGRVIATLADAGAPAGLPKWMALELTGKLPADGRVRLVYRTNMEVYFDQVLLGLADPAAPRSVHDVEAERAELRWSGYPAAFQPDGSRPALYRYDQLGRDETWTSQEGFYTRLGDVRALLGAEDDRMVVMSHGDELELRFPTAGLPALPAGWERRLVLYSVGYAKDLDAHSAAPLQVGPLPWRAMPGYPYAGSGPFGSEEMRASLGEWNTRYIRPAAYGPR